ncbi:YpmS family protein [Paenisporosarcina sp. TG20]|uniref:YpmS family protein n=1 Tax=Paenisporosarcina sp. TG20 TaxID=1211706 RepID=UPI0003171C7A|nr:YpmS family protein [Paenisporosarcina sp. TG20]
MNLWKVAFFILIALIVTAIIIFVSWISSPLEKTIIPEPQITSQGSVLTLKTTKEDFEGIANSYLMDAMKTQTLPITISIEDQILLLTELTIFSINLPITMKFDPIVEPNGNLRLVQTGVEVGRLEIPPESVLKLLKDSVPLPPWMIVRPDEQDVYIDLSSLPMQSNVKVKAKEFNLKQDEITLEILVPNN